MISNLISYLDLVMYSLYEFYVWDSDLKGANNVKTMNVLYMQHKH